MPDEYLPPNNVLFIQNLPEGTTSDDLREVFELCVSRFTVLKIHRIIQRDCKS
jgi:RNA recognition motif-containing protein